MKSTRRSFLRLVGAAPLAGRLAAEEAAKSLAGVGTAMGLGGGNTLSPVPCSPVSSGPEPTYSDIAKMLGDAAFRSEVESVAYRRHRQVGHLDLDLATKKSFSLAAKVTFQRQRNVQREMEEHSTEWVSPYTLFRKRFSIW